MFVVDADCLVAGVLTPVGSTTEIVHLWLRGAIELAVCPLLIGEVRRALLSARIRSRYSLNQRDVQAFLAALETDSVMFSDPIDPPRVVPGDPKDDYLIALALASDSILVTRDRHFEDLRVEGLRIVTPGLFLRELQQEDE